MLPGPIISIGDISIHMYGLMIGLGVMGTFIVLFTYGKKCGLGEKFLDFTFYNGIATVAFGFFSAMFFQAIYNYIDNPAAGFDLWNGGMTFIGGLIGGVAFFVAVYWLYRLYFHKKGTKPWGYVVDLLPIAPCCIVIAHAFGRVGCFFAGCCYGKETDGPLGVLFPGHTHPVHATQLYEAIFLFILFGVLSLLLLKWHFRHTMSVYLVCYGIFRFFLEYVRGDYRGELVSGITPSQFWSLCMVAGAVILYFALEYIYKLRDKKEVSRT